jgi:lysophospholipase L1-like esterase
MSRRLHAILTWWPSPRIFDGYLIALCLVVAGLIAVTIGCSPPPQAGNNPAIVGDSIVMGAQLDGEMNRMPDAYIDADAGRSVNGGGFATGRNAVDSIPLALSHLTPGGWLVLEIGTNDLPMDPALYRSTIADLVKPIPSGVCVAFVTVANWSTPERQGNSVAWNDAIRETARRRSCYRIIDWWENTRLRTYQVLKADLVHPNSWGEKELAAMIQWNTA